AVSRPDVAEGSLGGDPADPESIDALQSQLEDLFESLRQRRGNFFRFGKRIPVLIKNVEFLSIDDQLFV
ncbi:hypothetical protein TSMEX_005846, partial [Taenia solium]